jgi:hypothetical protein
MIKKTKKVNYNSANTIVGQLLVMMMNRIELFEDHKQFVVMMYLLLRHLYWMLVQD